MRKKVCKFFLFFCIAECEPIFEESEGSDEEDVVNKGQARTKHETKEEKKARKIAAKEAAKLRRQEKQATKLSFKNEKEYQITTLQLQKSNFQTVKL